jgi:hypothetical protein
MFYPPALKLPAKTFVQTNKKINNRKDQQTSKQRQIKQTNKNVSSF